MLIVNEEYTRADDIVNEASKQLSTSRDISDFVWSHKINKITDHLDDAYKDIHPNKPYFIITDSLNKSGCICFTKYYHGNNDIESIISLFDDHFNVTQNRYNYYTVSDNDESITFKFIETGAVSSKKNKGNEYETEVGNNFENEYQENVEVLLGLEPHSLDNYKAIQFGAANNRRPLIISGGSVVLSSGKYNNVGDAVKDVLLTNGADKINVSVKFGPSVTMANPSIASIIPDSVFIDYENSGIVTLTNEAKTLLNLFGIDPIKFVQTYVDYGTGNIQDSESVTLDKSKIKKYLISAVGDNYILIHKNGGTVHYYNLMTPKDTSRFIGTVPSTSTVYYGGVSGTGKRVDVKIETDNVIFTMSFRSKSSGVVYPKFVLCDYKIKR